MGVTVQRREPDETGAADVHIEAGEHVVVHEGGDLEVLDGLDGRRVAVFEAGTWLSAQVED